MVYRSKRQTEQKKRLRRLVRRAFLIGIARLRGGTNLPASLTEARPGSRLANCAWVSPA
ncbi:hypothetical protein J6590_017109 [Homalodisca vitripennis]|nr:hypothetical protein J6590_017109 [Homalodisca vitripennis]